MEESTLERLKNGDENPSRDFLRVRAKEIYSYPRLRGLHRLVEPGEFYEFISSKVLRGGILATFDPSRGTFDTWFAAVMENALKTLARRRGSEKSSIVLSEALEEIAGEEPSALDILEYKEEVVALRSAFSVLRPIEKAIVVLSGLAYREVGESDLQLLADVTGRDKEELIRGLEDLLMGEVLQEEEKSCQQSKRLAGLHRSLLTLSARLAEARTVVESKIENGSSDDQLSEAREVVERLEVAEWKKRIKYIELGNIARRGQGLVVVKNRVIAQFLQVPVGTITSTLTRLRRRRH